MTARGTASALRRLAGRKTGGASGSPEESVAFLGVAPASQIVGAKLPAASPGWAGLYTTVAARTGPRAR
eukprot:CAMPEP_0170308286 /NCGR_PEP_ID=MMETSP0116_2-20130129/54578_1 /TAXON_ID=400756 /ORGANISM="Durinskia baltica, Strain CSIRO CS-38" /LENGTH=68 /DNA_ID=CAMNT_0010560459 /DNA_START=55 /DNA_END=258 /DNA_ORIENTATION=+